MEVVDEEDEREEHQEGEKEGKVVLDRGRGEQGTEARQLSTWLLMRAETSGTCANGVGAIMRTERRCTMWSQANGALSSKRDW